MRHPAARRARKYLDSSAGLTSSIGSQRSAPMLNPLKASWLASRLSGSTSAAAPKISALRQMPPRLVGLSRSEATTMSSCARRLDCTAVVRRSASCACMGVKEAACEAAPSSSSAPLAAVAASSDSAPDCLRLRLIASSDSAPDCLRLRLIASSDSAPDCLRLRPITSSSASSSAAAAALSTSSTRGSTLHQPCPPSAVLRCATW